MRVVAGEFGGRRIVAPEGRDTRPTTDRVREALFNALGSAGVLRGALVADLFAGSGAIGLEALSRGAARCTFVERDRSALAALEQNVETLGVADRCRIVRGDALALVGSIDADIVLADPPYEYERWEDLLGKVRADLMIAESGGPLPVVEGWEVTREKRYGRTTITFLER
jgi:16S rRNA (guanine966-N2)-methyltransferase